MRCICLFFSFILYFKSFLLNESFSNLPIAFYLREKERDRDRDKERGNSTGSGKGNNYYNYECILPITISKNSFIKQNGFDGRFNTTKMEHVKINVIREYFYKMNILKILENTNISELTKLQLLDYYKFEYNNNNINTNKNIFIDLMDDWNNGLI